MPRETGDQNPDDRFSDSPRPADAWDDDRDRRRRDGREVEQPAGTSAFGVASLIIAIIIGIMLGALIVTAGVMANNQGGQLDEKSPEAIVIGCGVITGIGLAFLGAILGIIGVAGRFRGKAVAGIGLTLNALVLLGTIGIMCLGLAMKP